MSVMLCASNWTSSSPHRGRDAKVKLATSPPVSTARTMPFNGTYGGLGKAAVVTPRRLCCLGLRPNAFLCRPSQAQC
jgi:hypothetical protein